MTTSVIGPPVAPARPGHRRVSESMTRRLLLTLGPVTSVRGVAPEPRQGLVRPVTRTGGQRPTPTPSVHTGTRDLKRDGS